MKWNIWSIQEVSHEWIEWCKGVEIEADTIEEARVKAAKGFVRYNNETKKYDLIKKFEDGNSSCLTPVGAKPAWREGLSSNGMYRVGSKTVTLKEAIELLYS